jgi:hypothetical protein
MSVLGVTSMNIESAPLAKTRVAQTAASKMDVMNFMTAPFLSKIGGTHTNAKRVHHFCA